MSMPLRAFAFAASAALLPVRAEVPPGWFLGGGLTVANDSLHMVTHKAYGLNVALGLDRRVPDSEVGFRPALGITLLPGTWDGDSKTSLMNLQGSADLLVPVRYSRLRLVTGCSVNLWRYTGDGRKGQPNAWGLEGSAAPGSLKLGLRLGLVHRFDPHLSGELLWQIVEFGNHPSRDPTWRNFNPSWVQIGAHWHF